MDDHEIVRSAVVALLSREEDIEVIGQAGSGMEALDMAQMLQPDVVLMDVAMSNMDGLTATLELKRDHPDISVVALSMFSDRVVADQMIKAGADEYVCKGGPLSELLAAVRRCGKGNRSGDP